MNRLRIAACLAAALGGAACSRDEADVGAPAPVNGTAADMAPIALGMSRQQLENADLLSSDNIKLGEVVTLVVDAAGQVTAVVVELKGPADPEVHVPISRLRSVRNRDALALATDLSAAALRELPPWSPYAGA